MPYKGSIGPISRRVKIYDATAKKLLFTCETLEAAVLISGVPNGSIRSCIQRKNVYSKQNNLNTKLAFR